MNKMTTVKLKAEQLKHMIFGFALLAAALLLFPATSSAQTKKPITRDGLVTAVRINGLSTAELVQQIQSRGVSFRMTPDAEAALRAGGARRGVAARAAPLNTPHRALKPPAVPGRGERRRENPACRYVAPHAWRAGL